MRKFSIIIPVYNVAPYLRECLDSVLAQTYADWEAICVDDGSTDDSGEILNAYARKNVQFRVLHQENHGVSFARNVALSIVCGDFVIFMDADDLFLTHRALEYIGAELDMLEAGELLAYPYAEFQDDSAIPQDEECTPKRIDVHAGIPSDALHVLFWECVYPRSLIADETFPEQGLGEDMIFVGRILCKINAVKLMGRVLYGYRTRDGSASHGRHGLKQFREILTLNKFWLTAFAATGKPLTINGYDYVAQWLFEWNPQRLRMMSTQERHEAIHLLRELYRVFAASPGNRRRYLWAISIGECLGSYQVSRLLSGKMPRTHFGVYACLKRLLGCV